MWLTATVTQPQELRCRELLRHQLAQGKQCLFQADQKERQANNDVDEADDDPAQMGQGPADYQILETEQNDGDGKDIPHRDGGGPEQLDQGFHDHAINPTPATACRTAGQKSSASGWQRRLGQNRQSWDCGP